MSRLKSPVVQGRRKWVVSGAQRFFLLLFFKMGAITCLYTDGIEGEHITVYMAGEKLDNLYKEIVLEHT